MTVEPEDLGTPMTTTRWRRRLLVLFSAGALVAAGAGIEAIASIPDAHGVIHGCYSKSTGALRVVDSPKHRCPRGTKALTWNQRGPRGKRGPAGALATIPIDVSYDATRSTAYQIQVGELTVLLECGDGRIGTSQANVAVYADSIHGVTTTTESTSGSSTMTTSQIDADGVTALGDADVEGSHVAGTAYFDGVLTLGGAVDYLHIWWTRDTRQNHPVCAFQGSVVETGMPTIVPQ